MAQLYPTIPDPDTQSPAERRLYEAFARELKDDAWVVFHHVKWIGNDDRGRPCDGEADFVVAHPHLGVLVIEVKGGRIHFDARTGHFISIDRHDVEHDIGDPFDQATASKHTLIARLRTTRGWPQRRVLFGHVVAFPDAVVEGEWLRPNAPRKIIIDALDMVALEERLHEALKYWQGENPRDASPGINGMDALIRLLAQARNIRNPLVAEQARADQQRLVQLTERQYHYLRFLRGQRRAAVAGCAGSGKTFLALEKARQLAVDDGLKVLLTCYNRPLANYLGDTLGYRQYFDVFSFHQLCVHWAKQAGNSMPYRDDVPPDYFRTTLPNALFDAVGEIGAQYDAIIVDEGQDFCTEWWEVLPWLLHDPANGILYVFYDDNQRVYTDRDPIPIQTPPFVLDENCRNTQRVFDVVRRFYQGEELPNVLGPEGQEVEIIPYHDPGNGERQLRRLLHRLVNENGFAHDEIAVLSGLGRQTTEIVGKQLGNIQLTDELPLAPGRVFATTIRLFKGLERAAIVLCELDGRMSLQDVETLMYVGTSRAKTYMVILLGADAPPDVKDALL